MRAWFCATVSPPCIIQSISDGNWICWQFSSIPCLSSHAHNGVYAPDIISSPVRKKVFHRLSKETACRRPNDPPADALPSPLEPSKWLASSRDDIQQKVARVAWPILTKNKKREQVWHQEIVPNLNPHVQEVVLVREEEHQASRFISFYVFAWHPATTLWMRP